MNTVEPIRDLDLIQDMADYLKDKRERDYVLFMIGIHQGRRISDILPLKVRDVRNQDYIYLRETKTRKEVRLLINEELKEIIEDYIKDKKDYEYLFRRERGKNKPISRQRVWQILNEAADFFEHKDKIGCHSLRKTFGYWLYQETKDIVSIKELLNQSSDLVASRYIGINQDSKDKMISNLSFSQKR